MLTLNFHRADDDLFDQRIRVASVTRHFGGVAGNFAVAETRFDHALEHASRSIATSRIPSYAPFS